MEYVVRKVFRFNEPKSLEYYRLENIRMGIAYTDEQCTRDIAEEIMNETVDSYSSRFEGAMNA